MLDLHFIRNNLELVRAGIRNKGEKDELDRLLALDDERKNLLSEVETLRHRRNVVSKQIGELQKQRQNADHLIAEMRIVSQKVKDFDQKLRGVEENLEALMLTIPNVPHPSTPVGDGPQGNSEVRRWGEPNEFDFPVLDHLKLGERLDILDFKRASKIVGSGFPLYKGLGAQLERALLNFMLDLHIQKHGYREILPPFLANRRTMVGTGQLPKLEHDMYHVEGEDYFLIPTAEVPLTNLHQDEVLSGDDLPLNYVAYSACFRREAGSWGKDTRGFLRVHQFNKVELVKIVKPEDSCDALETLVRQAETVCQELEIPYRVVELCTADLGFAATKCYDIEVWSPAEGRWLEASSCSNFEDFQARRANIHFRRGPGAKLEYVHTLNGSALATSRLMVALLENYQTDEGTVMVPRVLKKYIGVGVIK
ncbi:serine--tRNA ligase [candidate division KSB1 bacterium]|nr:serine--tRNA ligase [candidate division KSB1 bacterium]